MDPGDCFEDILIIKIIILIFKRGINTYLHCFINDLIAIIEILDILSSREVYRLKACVLAYIQSSFFINVKLV